MFARPAAFIGWILLLACGPSLTGQVPLVGPGSRVRLQTLASGRVEGHVLRVSAETLIVASSAARIVVPLGAVQSLEVWRGARREWRLGAEIGSFIGFAGTAEVFALRMRRCVGLECAKVVRWEAYAAAGAMVGALVGGIVGAAFTHDRWERVAPGSVSPQVAVSAGTADVGLAIRF